MVYTAGADFHRLPFKAGTPRAGVAAANAALVIVPPSAFHPAQ